NMFLFFFFQAEDGIRDFHVTGVQTCALPISGQAFRPRPAARRPRSSKWTEGLSRSAGRPVKRGRRDPTGRGVRFSVAGDVSPRRSEERRVGKECRSGWGRGR